MANNRSESTNHTQALRSLMAQANIPTYRALSQVSGVSRQAIDRLRGGQVETLRLSTAQRLSDALGISLVDLIAGFGTVPAVPDRALDLRQECDRLQAQLATQAETVRQQVQQAAIAQLEPWLLQWPTAVLAAQQKPELSAQKLLPLVRPVEALVQSWGLTPLEAVGAEVLFDPRLHQAHGACLKPGQRVRVSHVGYRQGDRLLYRARVSAI
jgi:DNA-binding Xre family transcriptional regulator